MPCWPENGTRRPVAGVWSASTPLNGFRLTRIATKCPPRAGCSRYTIVRNVVPPGCGAWSTFCIWVARKPRGSPVVGTKPTMFLAGMGELGLGASEPPDQTTAMTAPTISTTAANATTAATSRPLGRVAEGTGSAGA